MPAHKHFDFRFLVILDKRVDIKLDDEELSNYRWVNRRIFKTLDYMGDIVKKVDFLVK